MAFILKPSAEETFKSQEPNIKKVSTKYLLIKGESFHDYYSPTLKNSAALKNSPALKSGALLDLVVRHSVHHAIHLFVIPSIIFWFLLNL